MGSLLDTNSSAVRKRIQSHTFENEHGEEYEASNFAGFADYMRRKKIKLQNLDAELRSSSASNPPIFRGVVAHVNGYTQPSLQDLHRLVVTHGGGFLQYLDGKTAATHIIASSLTPKKKEEFRRYRVVKPSWVVESVNTGRLLPWHDFRVIDEGQSQKVLRFEHGHILSQLNIRQSSYKDQSSLNCYTSQLRTQSADFASTPDHVVPNVFLNEGVPSDDTETVDAHECSDGQEPMSRDQGERMADEGGEICEATLNNLPPPAPDLDNGVVKTTSSSADRSRSTKRAMTSEEYNAQLLSDPRMRNSSVVNPDFLQQFYRESRLHHLSTWKAELKAQLQSAARDKSQSQQVRPKSVPGARKYIFHVDFDCFFAAVSIRKRPELQDKPVAIAHGTGSGCEIASCNYAARAFGVKNGMWMKGALDMCSELKVLPYDFPAYEDASRKFYSAVLAIDGVVQSVSIDEVLIDVTAQCLEAGGSDGRSISEGSIYREQAMADEIANALRASVKEKTGCEVSVGIGGNILLAKVALRNAKPAGQFQLKPDAVLEFIGGLAVQDLPGVGYSLAAKFEELGVKLVKDIRQLSREQLTQSLGPKTGAKMWDYARGIDQTEVGTEVMRKSVSAEVNWGIRFTNQIQSEDFLRSLCSELHRRLVENLVQGKQLTLKVMRRSADAPLEPVKHLGHGKCDVFNKSVTLGVATNAPDVLGKEAVSMLKSFGFSPGDLRGLGIQMTKLEPLKSGLADRSSQRQLKFDKPQAQNAVTREQRLDPDDVDSPHKNEKISIELFESAKNGPSLNDNNQKRLNVTGTQFILPTQADPKVVRELPGDIRSKLVSQGKALRQSRSSSPTPAARPPRAAPTVELPPQSQLDPEALAALPDDVRAEVLAYYKQTPAPQPSTATLQPSHPGPAPKPRKPPTPTKKRRGRLATTTTKYFEGNMTLTQSNFAISRRATPEQPSSRSASPQEQAEIPADFLAALPADIRREVLSEHRRTKLLQRSGPTVSPVRKPPAPKSAAPPPPPIPPAAPKGVALDALPERPTFTSKKLSGLSELRDAVEAWHAAFVAEGPFAEDVASLAKYLKRVVLEEKDLDKAVSVVNWMGWLVGHQASANVSLGAPRDWDRSSQGSVSWEEALRELRESVNEAVDRRGMPPVLFD